AGSRRCFSCGDELEVLRASLAMGSTDRASGCRKQYSQASSSCAARSAFRFRAAKRNRLSGCSDRLVSRSDFAYNSRKWHRDFQTLFGFFHSCHFCGAESRPRDSVSSWQLRMEGLSRNLLSLRELLYPHMFGEGGITFGL